MNAHEESLNNALSRIRCGMQVDSETNADLLRQNLITITPDGAAALTEKGNRRCDWPTADAYKGDCRKALDEVQARLDAQSADLYRRTTADVEEEFGVPTELAVRIAATQTARKVLNAIGLHVNMPLHHRLREVKAQTSQILDCTDLVRAMQPATPSLS